MPEKDWLAHVAIHSDAWLYSYAFYVAIRAGLDAETRMQLFDLINSNPAIYEIICGTANTRHAKEKPPGSSSKKVSDDTNITCGFCGDHWIFCGVCKTWYHGRCVAVTLAIEVYQAMQCELLFRGSDGLKHHGVVS
ncbi:PHD finger protein [Musa troglodytarum]|uniref:PHD finger protein ALFIN-LIKE n=1 Tax=Musa troglodytarum TaxID=320322 RepID=A0A9E7ICX4_9LILI|nr:PHD finger protein [Musa troglodytarum]